MSAATVRHAQLLAFGIALTAAACGALPPLSRRGPAVSRWSYTFALDEELTQLRATMCFDAEVPYSIAPIDRAGRRYLRSAEGPDGMPLSRVAGALLTDGLPPGSCVRYVVDLEAAARRRGGLHGAYRIDRDLIASTAVWLWAPAHRAEGAEARARFELPEGVRASPLWARAPDGTLRLDERAFRFTAYAAFGRFETRSVPVPGGCLRVSLLGRGVEMGADALVRCLAGSAGAAAMLFGRFPEREAGLLVVPTPFSSSSPFGVVGRGTMPTVAILVGERATEERLSRAWVPVHEFSHLATPFIHRRDAWLSEGLATYYQEVLRARAGLLRPEDAWQNLIDGFERGARAGTGRTLAEESRDMMQTAAFRRVYWAGAAIALMADVEIRRRTGGRRTLDDGIAALHACCGDRVDAMDASEAMARIDGGGPPIFTTIAQRALGSRAMPDLRGTYEALGIEVGPDGVRFGGTEEAAALRDSIMAPRLDLAPSDGACEASPSRRGGGV